MKKIKPSPTVTIIVFVVIFLIIEFACWGAFGTKFWELGDKDYWSNGFVNDLIYTLIVLACCVALCILSLSKQYYEYDENMLYIHMGKDINYSFKNISYIDEEYSIKHKSVLFYTSDGHRIIIKQDRKCTLLEIIKSKCKNLVSKDEYAFKHPNIKF